MGLDSPDKYKAQQFIGIKCRLYL